MLWFASATNVRPCSEVPARRQLQAARFTVETGAKVAKARVVLFVEQVLHVEGGAQVFFGNVFQPNPNDSVNGGDYARITQDSYYLVDLMARYRFNEHLSTTLNVKNLFDKKYYTGLGNFGTGFYGEPRSLQLATRWDF